MLELLPSLEPDRRGPGVPQRVAATATLAATIAGLGALLPGKVAPTAIAMVAPFASEGIMWLVREWAAEWQAERRAQAPTRRAERYLRQMERQLRKLPLPDPRRFTLQANIAELAARIHQHKMSLLELQSPARIAPLPATHFGNESQ